MHENHIEASFVPLDEALDRWLNELEFQKIIRDPAFETISTLSSRNRVTAESVTAKVSSPEFYMSAIDGLAVRSSDTYLASENPIKLKIGQQAIFVDLGRPIPEGFDSVIPINKVKFHSIEYVEIRATANPWQNVKPVGEDMVAKEIIIPERQIIRSLDIGAMLAGGVTQVKVQKRPVVSIFSVGDELLPPGAPLKTGSFYESSSHILKNICEEYGAEGKICLICPENAAEIKKRINECIDSSDILVIIAGRSEGTGLIANILNDIGDLVLFGVNSKPGQSICAAIVNKKCVIALPGYPVSTFISFELFAKPVIYRMLGIQVQTRETIKAVLGNDINSPENFDEFLRVKIGLIDSRIIAMPVSRGADVLMSLIRADGIVRVNKYTTFAAAGNEVEVELLTPRESLKNNLLITGSHDICLDIMANLLLSKKPPVYLYSLNVGSINAIKSIKEGNTHLAGIHIFDPETGEYNISFIQKNLKNIPIILVNLFHRNLGFIVKKGNPMNIKTFNDLSNNKKIKFINRNILSGTRTVLDYYIKKIGIEKESINGYTDEVYNHMALASAVASGSADAGIGILAAARSFKLDFIPVIPERFDIIVPKLFLGNKNIQNFLELLNTGEFKRDVEALGGYDLTYTGKIYYDS